MSCKIYRVSEVQVSHFFKNQELVKFKLAALKKSRVGKVQVSIFSKSKVSRVKVCLVPIMLKLELELMNLDYFSCFLFILNYSS